MLIRQALEERVGHAKPSDYGRQVLLARAYEAQMKRQIPVVGPLFAILPRSLRPVTSVLWTYVSESNHDSHMSLPLSNFSSLMLGLMR
jgi:hypothetical protein